MRKLVLSWTCLVIAVVFCAGGAEAAGTLSGTVTKNSVALPNAYIDVMDSGNGFQEVVSGPTGAYSSRSVGQPGRGD